MIDLVDVQAKEYLARRAMSLDLLLTQQVWLSSRLERGAHDIFEIHL
jgi:hypothetical protein